MDCQKARELVERHLKFLATLEGEKIAKKEEILDAFKHIKGCSDRVCSQYWRVVFRASMEFAPIKTSVGHAEQSLGWDGDC